MHVHMHVGVKVINLLLSLYFTLNLSNFEKNWTLLNVVLSLNFHIPIMEYMYTLCRFMKFTQHMNSHHYISWMDL